MLYLFLYSPCSCLQVVRRANPRQTRSKHSNQGNDPNTPSAPNSATLPSALKGPKHLGRTSITSNKTRLAQLSANGAEPGPSSSSTCGSSTHSSPLSRPIRMSIDAHSSVCAQLREAEQAAHSPTSSPQLSCSRCVLWSPCCVF